MIYIDNIKNNPTYKLILKDSFGGVMYDVANKGKYDTKELEVLYLIVPPFERDNMDGIMKGVFQFLKEA